MTSGILLQIFYCCNKDRYTLQVWLMAYVLLICPVFIARTEELNL